MSEKDLIMSFSFIYNLSESFSNQPSMSMTLREFKFSAIDNNSVQTPTLCVCVCVSVCVCLRVCLFVVMDYVADAHGIHVCP